LLAGLFRLAPARVAFRAGAALAVRFSLRARAGLAAVFRPLAFVVLAPAVFRAVLLAVLARFPAPVRLEEGVGLGRFVLPLFLAIGVSLLRCQWRPFG
jgi:hypothetical protein